ncbi:hypothetical protein AB0L34_23230 [Micromonospora sp. NPDC052213]|uniref:hypothetical protein n=1 Tax=Micromonospora sp. NPDC052213 TaxID=3155812 RepID=UPI00343F5D26
MGSDWIWELRMPTVAEPALRELYALAADRNLRPQRPDGLINLFTHPDAELRTVEEPQAALDAMATGKEHGQLWTDGDVDIFVNWQDGTLAWTLDGSFCYRRPVPEADAFRELHARLTGLWLDVAERLMADVGRILDEWSSEQVLNLGIHDDSHTAGGWPAELGWWTYLGPNRHLPPAPLPEIAAQARRLPSGALLIELLDDPAAVGPLRYQDIHTRWLRAA